MPKLPDIQESDEEPQPQPKAKPKAKVSAKKKAAAKTAASAQPYPYTFEAGDRWKGELVMPSWQTTPPDPSKPAAKGKAKAKDKQPQEKGGKGMKRPAARPAGASKDDGEAVVQKKEASYGYEAAGLQVQIPCPSQVGY